MAPMSPGTTKAGLCQEQDASTPSSVAGREMTSCDFFCFSAQNDALAKQSY